MKTLELHEDIYSLAYLCLITSEDVIHQRDLNFKCFLTFMTQLGLAYLVINESLGRTWRETFVEGGFLYQGNYQLNITRIICAIILHMSIMPEVRSSIDMMRYVVNNPHKFNGRKLSLPFFLSFIKFSAAIITESLNIFKMGEASSIDDVVKDFIAFGIIAEIDNQIVGTISSVQG